MSKIDEMINELCPDGVEKVKLGDVCDVLRGARLTKAQISDIESVESPYPVLHGGLSPMGFYKEPNRKAGTTIVVNTGNAGSVYYSENDFWSSDACFSLYPHEGLIDKYLYYYLYGMEYILKGRIRAGAMPTIDSLAVETLQIPLPPLSIQQNIVSVLDSFTTLIDKMKQEVEKRKKQMEYYREKLLTFKDGECEWKTLGDIGEVRMCKRILKSQTQSSGDIPFYKIGTFGKTADAFISKELFDEYKSKYNYPKNGDILISAAGTIGRCVTFDGTPSYFQDSNIVWIENDETQATNRYLKRFYSIAKWNIQNGGSVARLYNDNLKSTEIPVPPLDKQSEIVATLDKFESYITKLEKMIVLRQKQYEYYREQLLTFE